MEFSPFLFHQEEEEAEKDYDVRTEPYIQLCIPYLPRWLAAICLIMNVFIPGTGMYMSCDAILGVWQNAWISILP